MAGNKGQEDTLVKLMMVGDSEVGKTAMLTRMCDDDFHDAYIVTIGVDFKSKTVERGGRKFRVQVWDTAGQERFGTINCAYYRGAMGMIITYSVTNRESFDHVEKWVKELDKHGSPSLKRVLVGNKCDLDDARVVSNEEGTALAKEFGLDFFETSAKAGTNIDNTFMHLVDLVGKDKFPAAAADTLKLQKPVKKTGGFC